MTYFTEDAHEYMAICDSEYLPKADRPRRLPAVLDAISVGLAVFGAIVILLAYCFAGGDSSGFAGAATSTDRSLHVWHADWCPHCNRMEPHVKRLQDEGEPVLWLDYDALPESAKKWGVHRLPTTIVVEGGKERHRKVGYLTYDELKGLL